MNKRIAYLILGLAVVGGLSACTKQLVEEAPLPKNTHTVYFSSSAAQTKTGISIKDQVVTPNWQGTTAANSHLFEYDANDAVSVGEAVEINIDDNDNTIAHFIADFPSEWLIVADPSGEEEGSGVSSGSTATPPFTYAAIIAQQVEGELEFVVPAEQQPQTNTLIDPTADFLIGYSRKAYDDPHNFDEQVVNLWFDRPVALGRFALTNLGTGEKVKSVTVSSTEGMTGSTTLDKIDFENAAVNNFTRKTDDLVLSYGDGVTAEGATFFAYFVTLPGTVHITEIKVETDAHLYTKTIDGGKEFTFSNTAFKNIGLDLSSFTIGDVTPTNHTWYKASKLEAGYDYIIVSEGQALKNNGNGNVVAAQEVEIVDNTISPEQTEGIIWKAADVPSSDPDNNGYVLADYGTYTLTNGSEHLWRYSNNGTFRLQATSGDFTKYMIWNYDGEYLTNHSIYVSNGNASHSDYYAYYDGGWKISTTTTKATLFTPRAPQTLSFGSPAEAEYDLATSEWTVAVPTLSGAQTSVTYALSEDSNPAVATVDADGTVRPLSRGTVTIVAIATGNDQYQAASASYTLVITDSSITTPTWYKASVLEAGYGYIIVSNGHVLVKNKDGEIPFAKEVSVSSNNTIAMESSEDILWTAAAVTSDYGQCTLKNGSVYLYRSGYQDSNLKLICEETSSANYVPWRYDGNYLSNGKTTQYYAYYDGGWKMLLVSEGSTGKPIVTTQLFTLRAPQTLSFDSPAKAEYDLYSKSWTKAIPTPSGYQTTVTYALSEDSNPAVATVDADGTVHPLSKGTVTIVATAEGNAQYQAASASYELEVIDTTPVEMVTITLKKATRLSAGQKYVLVSNGKALVRDGSDAATADFNSSDLTVAVPTSLRNNLEWTLKQPGNSGNMYQFTNNEYYFGIARKTSPTPYTYWITVSTTPDNLGANTTMMNVAISLADEDIYYKGSNNSQYIYFDKASNQWDRAEISNNDSNTDYKTALYVVDDGTTPGGGDDQVTVTTYQKVSSDSDLTVGSKYIIVYEEGSKAFKPILPSSSSSTFTAGVNNVEEVSISGAMIHSEALSDSQIILEKEGDNYYLYVKSSQKYLSFSRNGLLATTDKSNTNGNYNVSISISGGIASLSRNSSGTPYYILFDSYFKNSSSSPNVSLYKLVE